jgi:catechol 2,3-dioxygenase-like lactoylglutathione lyase family enzyme
MADLGLTHVAFSVRDLAASVAFYERYAGMTVVHRRTDEGSVKVAWVTDHTRPFVVVLIEGVSRDDTPLGPFGHLGVACKSRDEVDRLCALAAAEGRLRKPATDSGPPVGYWAFIADPDGNTLEVSHGQDTEFTVASEK